MAGRCRTRVILGPPGTGKTTRLIRVAQDLCSLEERKDALFVSHTTIAAKELGRRCGMDQATAKTLHSVCYGLLSLTRAQVVDDAKLRVFGKYLNLDFDEDNWPREALGVQAMAESSGVPLEEAYMNSSRPCGWSDVRYVCSAYDTWKHQNGFLDFTDMLTRVAHLKPESRWTKLFIDEAQDFSPVAWELVRLLARHAEMVVVAGDDDQAIFEWSGADPHGVDTFINEFGSDVEVLNKSYRVPHLAHAMAQRIAGRIRRRIDKTYDACDRTGTYRYTGSFDALRANDLRDSTVLYRDKSVRRDMDEHLQTLRMRFTSSKAPQSPYDKREAVALRILAKLRDGKTISVKENKALRGTLSSYALGLFDMSGVGALDKVNVYAMFDAPQELLEYLSVVDVTKPPEVRLSTIHNFKGAEDDRVVLCTGMSDRTSIGLSNNPDPEQRVWYVGVTRTKNDLIVAGGDNEYQI